MKTIMALFTVWCGLSTMSGRADATEVHWRYEVPTDLTLEAPVEGPDGGVLVVVNDDVGPAPHGRIISVSEAGKVLWEKRYSMLFGVRRGPAAVAVGREGVIIVGSLVGSASDSGVFAMRVDLEGELVWMGPLTKDYGVDWVVVDGAHLIARTFNLETDSESTLVVRETRDNQVVAERSMPHALAEPVPTDDGKGWMAATPDGSWVDLGAFGFRPSERRTPNVENRKASWFGSHRRADGGSFSAFMEDDMMVLRVPGPAGDVILKPPDGAEVSHVAGIVVRGGGGFFVGMRRLALDADGSRIASRPLPGLVLRVQ
jgi:hypothetical protein